MRQCFASRYPSPLSGAGRPYPKSGASQRGASIADRDRALTAELDEDDIDPSKKPLDPTDWTEEEIVFLHWRLLKDVQHLADPATPLDEKLSTLRWIFTEADKDARPFSFVNCLRVVGCSPLSPIAYCGRVDSEAIREHIASNARRWLTESLTSYPDWVAHALADNPAWVEAQLDKNPQCINEQVKDIATQGDLFA